MMMSSTLKRRHSSGSMQQEIDSARDIVHVGIDDDDGSEKTNSLDDQQQRQQQKHPLSWDEARSRLRHTMEEWKLERKRGHRSNESTDSASNKGGRRPSLVSVEDPDMLFLALPLSLLFVVLAFALPMDESEQGSSFLRMQQSAALLFLLSSIISAGISRRRRDVSRDTDRSIERRRCVSAFLKGMEGRRATFTEGQQRRQGSTASDLFNAETIPRKNVEDVYSTYRRVDRGNSGEAPREDIGQWHRIPSLLLVEGDFIALKVGDSAPAKCNVVRGGGNATVEAGERLSVESLSPLARETLALSDMSDSASLASIATVPHSNTTKTATGSKKGLPPGRSTLNRHSPEMLLLANGVQIYVLLETPLHSFLRKEDAQKRNSLPQVLRQGVAVRKTLIWIALVAFLSTLCILLVRPGGAQNFFQSPSWMLPVLAALSVLPVVTPLYLFWVECIGTSRILAWVHPIASNQKRPTGNKIQSSVRSLGEGSLSENSGVKRPSPWLLCRYLTTTASSRLLTNSLMRKISSWMHLSGSQDALLSIPPASLHILEKLGVVTAIALVDDELACEPFSTPQQLLIPSGQGGMHLLDICPLFDDDDAYSTDEEGNMKNSSSLRGSNRQGSDLASYESDDSNEETRFNHSFSAPARTLRRKLKRNYRKIGARRRWGSSREQCEQCTVSREADGDDELEVQFEDPNWWQFLPALKCIGLTCCLSEERRQTKAKATPLNSEQRSLQKPHKVSFHVDNSGHLLTPDEASLVDHICCDERERKQLQLLAQCIGFDTGPNALGPRGDLSSFEERRRLHILSTHLLRQRLQLDSHALGLEESRNWSRLFTDADIIIARDLRSGGDLVLTVGDSRVVTQLCPDWWQGENSTISPLSASDRQIVNETQKNWMLSDLDVQAFSYAPLPYTADQMIERGGTKDPDIYLLDNAAPNAYIPSHGFWSLVKNQIFLGLLGSSVRPRKEIEPLIDSCADAGVRFVYFSPRNMRRTKELASQMGIDVAWNCAISLRPLEEGTDDSFRMTSNYADWDVNARLPHGVEDVRRHLEEVDNVPLLVSLYTDVTKKTAADMVNVFQEYSDTVLSVGLSHLPGNQDIFSRADIAIGVDDLGEDVSFEEAELEWNALLPDEVAFVTSISTHSSVFNLWGSQATSHFVDIIRIGRACLEAATSGVGFVLSGCLSFSMFILLCPCTAATAVPVISALDSYLYLQLLLPLIGAAMASSDEAKDFMTRVPPKNDLSTTYSFRANTRPYFSALLRASVPAIIPQLVYLLVLGELMWEFDTSFVLQNCLDFGDARDLVNGKAPIASIIRCEALRDYSGPATQSAGSITLATLACCTCLSSASHVFRTESIRSEPPWARNRLWFGSLIFMFILIALYLAVVLEQGSMVALSWYFYLLFVLAPFVCVLFSEAVKRIDQKHEKRAIMMRRLQFETRLGMWSPKESTHPGDAFANNRRENMDSPMAR